MHVAYIGLGSNLGDRNAMLSQAADRLRASAGIHGVLMSSVHETEPVGGPVGQPMFANAAARVETSLDPRGLLELLLRIEADLGRIRRERWGPRTIDLDLLLYDDCAINEPDLVVPHPRMHERRFVLAPLAELAQDWPHPILHKTVAQLLQESA